ncbi:TauD/TfdA dioxygenase family protein [Variovorax paradoxus]|uniref:TauD/TfdA dioxygenase family protein n=1 Tax=Variovorax paradoxus TaxID=34073 RepID=UPI00102D151C|nr:TauD/TfdA family dioxygenase [Variovorax paradoxus]
MTVETKSEFEVRPLAAPLGAVVEGFDLGLLPEGEWLGDLEAALHQHRVLVFRNQRIDDGQMLHFSKYFGKELDIHAMTQFAKPDNPEVFVLSNIVEDGRQIGAVDAAQYWHSDLCYTRTPSRVSILYALEVPVKGGRVLGPTDFADTAAAYYALPAEIKEQLQGRKARFVASKKKPSQRASHFNKMNKDTESRLEDSVVHPVIRTHPTTGEKSIFVNEGFTTEILDMEQEESERLLNYLYAFTRQPRFIYRHTWAPGDVVVWDNALTLHQGVGDYALPQRRLLYRTIVKGTVPF